MKRYAAKTVAHRWGLYFGDRLAYGAIGHRLDGRTLSVQVLEAQWHAEKVPLPVRIRFECRLRALLESDLTEAYGSHLPVTIRFEPKRVDEVVIASLCLGVEKSLPA